MTELKPCPFCGAKESDEHGLRLINFSRNNTLGVECYRCEAMIGYTRYNTQEEAIEAWNSRCGAYNGLESAAKVIAKSDWERRTDD